MNNLTIKILAFSGLVFLLICTGHKTFGMVLPREEFAVYQAMIGAMPDQVLVQKYQEEFARLQKTFKDATKDLDASSISQLPVFKVAVFKTIINEIKKRQAQTHKTLLTSEQINSADNLIHEKEGIMKAGSEEERRHGH